MSQPSSATPFPLDTLRRHAIALGAAVGMPSPRAADLAHHVLWYETLGASELGLKSLPKWLALRDAHDHGNPLDLSATGHILDERTGTARLDASRTLPPLAMSQAATVAAEKARENGTAVIQVVNLIEPCPAGDVASREALGPVAVAILTARPAWVAALPAAGELPFLADSDLDPKPAATKSRSTKPPAWVATLAPMLAGFAPQPSAATVLAIHVPAVDSLDRFRDRLAAASHRNANHTWLTPEKLAATRREAEERGLLIPDDLLADLNHLADQLGIPGLGGTGA